MSSVRVFRSQRGFIQYIVLGVLLVLAAGAVTFFQHRHASNDQTASLTGTGGVTIVTPDNNSTVTSPVQVTANVAPASPDPSKPWRYLETTPASTKVRALR